MPVRPDAPLRKVTLNLYEADCKWMEAEYGHGWTERVRQHIHHEVHQRTQFKDLIGNAPYQKLRRTLGDLE